MIFPTLRTSNKSKSNPMLKPAHGSQHAGDQLQASDCLPSWRALLPFSQYQTIMHSDSGTQLCEQLAQSYYVKAV